MSGQEKLPNTETEAKSLAVELATAFHGLKQAASTYSEVQGRVGEFLDSNGVIPRPPEGLEEEMNELYLFWEKTPDAEEVFKVIDR